MSAIDVQNAKQIRPPMVVSCGIAARINANLTASSLSGFAVADSNLSVSLDEEEWTVLQLADLQQDGFPLDGSRVFYSAGSGSETGKIGVRTHIGGSGSLTISAANEIPALTIYSAGTGTITTGGVAYEARGVNVIPVNSTSAELVFASDDENARLEVYSITPGINISWDTDTIISVELDLRSDLSIKDNKWEVSEIEIQAYYPDDISEAITNIADNVPIWYTAGYPGDMSPVRNFYLSEHAEMENNIITLKGQDSSYKLGEKQLYAQILNTTTGTGKNKLYARFVNIIKDAGIKIQRGQAYPSTGAGATKHALIIKEGTADTAVQDIINLSRGGTFWPLFVDAGIPTVSWTVPTSKWDIYEADCGDIVREIDRNLAKITASDDNGLTSEVKCDTKAQEITRKTVDAYGRYSWKPDGYWWWLSVTNAYDIITNAEMIAWTAKNATWTTTGDIINSKTGKQEHVVEYHDQSIVKGKAATVIKKTTEAVPSPKRAGYTMEMTPNAYGKVMDDSTLLYPRYANLFDRSNITGKFTWKGDPRMQPRDVFTFHRLDGTTETCTIAAINLKHDGGTVADIEYRKGVC